MKKIVMSLLLVFSIVVLSACGDQKEASRGILPSRIEQIDQGGVIPEGSEAKVNGKGDYSLDMLWGTWVMEESGDNTEGHITDETINLSSGEDDIPVECFPEIFSIGPAWSGIVIDSLGSSGLSLGSGRGLAEHNRNQECMTGALNFGYEDGKEVVDNPLGDIVESWGYGIGGASFATKEEDPILALSLWPVEARKVVYGINENILSFGITDMSPSDDFADTDIYEIDYEISFQGYKLQLTYNDVTVIYIPEVLIQERYDGIDIKMAGATESSDIIDGILGITISGEELSNIETGIMYDIHEGYVDAEFDYTEDGSLTINTVLGDQYEYDYLYSGDSLTLISDEQTSIYSLYDYIIPSPNNKPGCDFLFNGQRIWINCATSILDLLELGLETPIDLNQPISSCQVTDEIELTYQNAKLIIKAGNPYNYDIELGNCKVCYYYINDTSGIFTKGDNTDIGISTYEFVDFLYAPYEKRDDSLRYIADGGQSLELGIRFDSNKKRLISGDGFDVIYEFEDGILNAIRIEEPELLYNGLQDNVEYSVLSQMDSTQFSGVLTVRNTILDRLNEAFAAAGIVVDINASSGEIVMDNDILFGVDQYELSEQGKQYIDSFMSVYGSVITAEEFSDYISEVRFEGHTDSSGDYGYNLILSQKRADAVLNYCLESTANGLNDVQKSKLQELSYTIGHSYSDPVVDENGNEDMDASRRVAIKFYLNVE